MAYFWFKLQVNTNKLHDHLDSVTGLASDTDSLSSFDDNQFKHLNPLALMNKRTSASVITSSTNNSDTINVNMVNGYNHINNSNSVNAPNSVTTASTTNNDATTTSSYRSYNVVKYNNLTKI